MNVRKRRWGRSVRLWAGAALLSGLLPGEGNAASDYIDIIRAGGTKAEACEGVRRDAHVMMGGPRQGGRLPSYCGDCVREVVTKAGKAEERWTCTVTVEIFND